MRRSLALNARCSPRACRPGFAPLSSPLPAKPLFGPVANCSDSAPAQSRPQVLAPPEPPYQLSGRQHADPLNTAPSTRQPLGMHSYQGPGPHAEHALNHLGLPAHRRGPHRSAGDQNLPPAGDDARPIGLGVDNPHSGGPDHKMVDVGPASWQGQVMQHHPTLPWQFLQEGGSDDLTCRPPGPAAGVRARPQKPDRAGAAAGESQW